MGLISNLITSIKNTAKVNTPSLELANHVDAPSVHFPPHTNTSFELSNANEHVLEMVKINFDSRYSPAKYRIDTDVMPTKKDKANGRIVLLWWLNKNNILEKFPPSYFYFRYGLYIDEEVRYLNELGWLNQFTITDLGQSKLKNNSDVIDRHRYLSEDNKQFIMDHRDKINDLADNFVDVTIDLNNIKLNPWNEDRGLFTDEEMSAGFQYLEIAQTLTKQKEYEKSLQAVAKAWSLGYQSQATWMRGAINARFLKDRQLEEAILLMGIKWARLSNYPTYNFDKRLKRVHELMAKKFE